MMGHALRAKAQPPCATSGNPRVVPQLSRYTRTPAQVFFGGPFTFHYDLLGNGQHICKPVEPKSLWRIQHSAYKLHCGQYNNYYFGYGFYMYSTTPARSTMGMEVNVDMMLKRMVQEFQTP